jgi:hypothetical protein
LRITNVRVPPFSDESQDASFETLLTQEPEFRVYGHQASLDLMRRLLKKDPEQRLGIEEIKAHRLCAGPRPRAELSSRLVHRPRTRRTFLGRRLVAGDAVRFDVKTGALGDCMLPGFSFGAAEDLLRFKFT